MKQRAETKADIEKKIDQCNRRLALIQIVSNELKAVRADLGNWEQNLSVTGQDRLSLSASVGGLLQSRQAPPRGRTLADNHPAVRTTPERPPKMTGEAQIYQNEQN